MDWDIDWDDAFDNMGSVEGSHLFVDRWGNLSSQFRERWAQTGSVELDVSYGSHPRQKFDLFRPEGPSRGTIIFVHGGYWIRTSKETWSFLAEGALANGWNVVLPGYPLAPEVKVADITRSIIDAVTVIISKLEGPMRLIGHSAGGHLVSRMACEGVLPDEIIQRIESIISLSGLHDLRPLLSTGMNDALKLDLETAAAESSTLSDPTGIPFMCWVGAAERPEFLRQNRLLAEAWSAKQGQIDSHYDPGHNHFSVVEQLSEPQSNLTLTLVKKLDKHL